MNLRRLRSSFAFTLLMALVVPILAACGGTATPTANTTPVAAPATAAVTVAPATVAPATAAPVTETTPPVATAAMTAMTEVATAMTAMATAETAVAATAPPTAGTGNKVLRVNIGTYPDVMDPQKSSYSNEIGVLALNYEGLTRLDKDLKAVPAAADKFEFNKAGDSLTFHIRDGLKYSDGSPVTSENFQYAVQRTCDPQTAGEYQSILFEIKGCEAFASTLVTDTAAYNAARDALLKDGAQAPDPQTFVLNMTNPAPYYTYIGGLWVMYPVKKELVEKGGENWWQTASNHIGNGPYKITDIKEDQQITFAANENYWNGRPKLDGVEYQYIKESSVALEAYKAGQLDVITPDPSQLPAIDSDAELKAQLLKFPAASTIQMQFNLTREPFNDEHMRKAMSYAFDRETYTTDIRNGDAIPTLTWIPEGIPGSVSTDKFGYDPAKAKEEIALSKYKTADKVPPIKFSYSSNDPAARPRIEYIAGMIRDATGIEVTLDPVEGKALTALKKDVKTYPQMSLGGWNQDYPDPQNWLSVYWLSSATFAKRVGFKNTEFDKLVKQGDVELNPEKRLQLYQQAGQILIDTQAGVNLYNPAHLFLIKPELTGYDKTPADSEFPGMWSSLLTIDVNR